uniref:Uncharacterized protein n=1 Tax=Cupriavidus taiwanensis TaxID=164546 RepID=A0A375HCY6_9BURK|nr:protein of unknown function [Cupriavidus taiwanensis]
MNVVVLDVALDLQDQLAHAVKRPAADRLLRDQPEPALELIEPARVRRREVHVTARAFGQPCLDLGMLVSGVVVRDHVDVQFCWNGLVNVVQKRDELLVPMPGLALRNDLGRRGVESSEQRSSAMTNVIMRDALYVAQALG